MKQNIGCQNYVSHVTRGRIPICFTCVKEQLNSNTKICEAYFASKSFFFHDRFILLFPYVRPCQFIPRLCIASFLPPIHIRQTFEHALIVIFSFLQTQIHSYTCLVASEHQVEWLFSAVLLRIIWVLELKFTFPLHTAVSNNDT